MKNLFLCLMLLAGLNLAAQTKYDLIHFKNGEIVKCKISEVNIDSFTIFYTNLKTGGEGAVSLKDVGSYVWDGEVNKGLPKPMLKRKPVVINDDKVYSGDHNLFEAGEQLVKFSSLAQSGIVVSLIGSGFVAMSATIFKQDPLDPDKFSNERKLTATAGYIFIAGGFIMNVASYSHARKAGEKLKLSRNIALNSNQYGLGLSYQIK